MANKQLRFTLDDNTNVSVVSDPIGYDDADIILERSEKYWGLFKKYSEQKLTFYGDGYDFIRNAIDTDGINAEVKCKIESSVDNGATFSDEFSGILDLEDYDITFNGDAGTGVEIGFSHDSFTQKFLQHQDTKVNINLNKDIRGNALTAIGSESISMFAQPVIYEDKRSTGTAYDESFTSSGQTIYGFLKLDSVEIDDLALGAIDIQSSDISTILGNVSGTYYESLKGFEGDTDFIFDVNLNVVVTGGAQTIDSISTEIFIQKNSETAISVGGQTSETPGTVTHTQNHQINATQTFTGLVVGDTVKWYIEITYTLSGSEGKNFNLSPVGFEINTKANTEFQTSTAFGYFIHEAVNKITNAITGFNKSLYSEYFGNTQTQDVEYTSDGCGSFNIFTKGYAIRKNSLQSGLPITFEEMFESLNAIYNIGVEIEYEADLFVNEEFESNIDGWDDTGETGNPWDWSSLNGGSAQARLDNVGSNPTRRLYQTISNRIGVYYIDTEFVSTGTFTSHEVAVWVYNGSTWRQEDFYQETSAATTTHTFTASLSASDTRIAFRSQGITGDSGSVFLYMKYFRPRKRLIRIEPKHFFFETGNPVMRLENIPDLKRSIAREFLYNAIEIGFDKWGADGLPRGNFEFNTKHNYSTLLETIGTNRKILSKFITAGFSIEWTRQQQLSNDDWDFDDDYFLIAMERTAGSTSPEQGENFSVFTNIENPDKRYNMRFTPARSLLRWGNVLNIGLQEYAGEKYYNQGGEGYDEIVTEITGETCEGSFNNDSLDEDSDIQWDYTASPETPEQTPLFKPIWYEFSYPLTLAQFTSLANNTKKTIEISEDGTTYFECFIWKVSYKIFEGLAQFKVIRAT